MIPPTEKSLVLPHPSREGETVAMTYYEWKETSPSPLMGEGRGEGETVSIPPSPFPLPHGERVLLCVHGLSRNGRDFDTIASALADHYRVISVDMPGRGKSPWLPHKEDYNYDFYSKILGAFIARLGITKLDWLGTSMGGILGMIFAAFQPTLVGRLVVNDVGPFVAKEGLQRISQYLSKPLQFASRAEAETYMRTNYVTFGLKEEWQWQHVFAHSIVERGGAFFFAYDYGIMDDMRQQTKNFTEFKDVDLWPVWKLVKCPVLILRGMQSELLRRDTAQKMLERDIPTELMEIEGVGHAPALMDDAQINRVRTFLIAGPAAQPIGRLSRALAWCMKKLLPHLIKR